MVLHLCEGAVCLPGVRSLFPSCRKRGDDGGEEENEDHVETSDAAVSLDTRSRGDEQGGPIDLRRHKDGCRAEPFCHVQGEHQIVQYEAPPTGIHSLFGFADSDHDDMLGAAIVNRDGTLMTLDGPMAEILFGERGDCGQNVEDIWRENIHEVMLLMHDVARSSGQAQTAIVIDGTPALLMAISITVAGQSLGAVFVAVHMRAQANMIHAAPRETMRHGLHVLNGTDV